MLTNAHPQTILCTLHHVNKCPPSDHALHHSIPANMLTWATWHSCQHKRWRYWVVSIWQLQSYNATSVTTCTSAHQRPYSTSQKHKTHLQFTASAYVVSRTVIHTSMCTRWATQHYKFLYLYILAMLMCKTLPQLCASLFAQEDDSHRVLLVVGAAAIHAICMQESCKSNIQNKYFSA